VRIFRFRKRPGLSLQHYRKRK